MKSAAKNPPAPQQDRAIETREAIMRAALGVFSDATFAGARIQEVADRAGIGLSTIYRHFESKEHLGNEVFRRCKALTRHYAVPEPMSTPRETFHAYWQQLTAYYRDHPDAFTFLQTQHYAEYLDEESIALTEKIDSVALERFTEWEHDGIIRRGDPELMVAIVLAVFAGVVAERKRHGDSGADDSAFEFAEQCAWDMVSPSGR